jgi:gamma-glutamyl-gamma-aminobutyrate hydrolase PuuD
MYPLGICLSPAAASGMLRAFGVYSSCLLCFTVVDVSLSYCGSHADLQSGKPFLGICLGLQQLFVMLQSDMHSLFLLAASCCHMSLCHPPAALQSGKPFLGICLGLQQLFVMLQSDMH